MQTAQAEYEFDPAQNTTIRQLAGGMKFCGVFELVIGIIYGILAAFALLGSMIGGAIVYGLSAVVWIILAGMQMRAAGYFRAVVDTHGSDITLLMAALAQLRGYFGTKRVLYMIALALFIVGLVVVILTLHRYRPDMR
jgi:hypothetical protein